MHEDASKVHLPKVNPSTSQFYMSEKLYPSYHMFIMRILKDLSPFYYLYSEHTIIEVTGQAN